MEKILEREFYVIPNNKRLESGKNYLVSGKKVKNLIKLQFIDLFTGEKIADELIKGNEEDNRSFTLVPEKFNYKSGDIISLKRTYFKSKQLISKRLIIL